MPMSRADNGANGAWARPNHSFIWHRECCRPCKEMSGAKLGCGAIFPPFGPAGPRLRAVKIIIGRQRLAKPNGLPCSGDHIANRYVSDLPECMNVVTIDPTPVTPARSQTKSTWTHAVALENKRKESQPRERGGYGPLVAIAPRLA